MTKYELVKVLKTAMMQLEKNSIAISDARYVEMYEDWLRLREEGHKFIYIIHYLSQQYEISKTSVYRLVRKFSETCDF